MERYTQLTKALQTKPTTQGYETLLEEYVFLHGYWIAYANYAFRTQGSDAAEAVFQRALKYCSHSLDLWCAYILFLIQINRPQDKVSETFREADSLVGSQFQSHKLWDLWIEYAHIHHLKFDLVPQLPELEPVEEILYHILKTRTLHQFSRYFKHLKTLTKLDENHLIELYTKQQSRVSKIWRYERFIKRPFFHPSRLSDQERKNWESYLGFIAGSEKNNLFARAVEIDPYNEQLWMKYIRWLIAGGQDPLPAFELACKALPKGLDELRLYYILWLEYTAPDTVGDAFAKLPKTFALVKEQAEYIEKSGGDPLPVLKGYLPGAGDTDAAGILSVLIKYEPDTFDKNLRDSVEFYRACLEFAPQLSDKVLELAPANSVDAEYLRALRKTDIKKYLEMERAFDI